MPKGDNMKITIDSKELKNILQIVTLRGKYNQGLGSKIESLPDQIYIHATNGMVYFYNGNPSTFVVYRHECENVEDGSFCVSSTMLAKYLDSGEVTISEKDSRVRMLSGSSVITFPSVFRSPHLNIVVRLKDYLSDLTYTAVMNGTSAKVTDRLTLEGIYSVRKSELVDAMNMAERVGNSVYRLDADAESMVVSSQTTNQEVTTNIWCKGVNDIASTTVVSLPVGKVLDYVDDARVALCFEDDKPLVIATDSITIMRAPREEPR